METGCTGTQLSLKETCLNSYVNKVILNTFAKMSKLVFALSLWGCVQIDWGEKNIEYILEQGCNVTTCGKSQGV